jgi:cell shape-determining protein MreC
MEAKDKTAEEITDKFYNIFLHGSREFENWPAVKEAMAQSITQYSAAQNASLKEELQRVYELVKKWHNQSDANEQCWKETVKDYNDLRERYKHLHEENERLKAACNMAAIEIEKGTADQLTVDALRSALSPSN